MSAPALTRRSVLVVGGAGYIGSHMVLALQDAGYQVVVLDNLSRGHADAIHGAPLVRADLNDPASLEACFQAHPVDLVMHFAAFAYVGESVMSPSLYYQNNTVGTLNLLDAMRRHGVSRFVFSSTCATYGEPTRIPIGEDCPQAPINPYGRSKWMVEMALKDYAHAYKLQSISLRYFNAAGCDPNGRAGERHDPETHLIPLVLQEALRTQRGGDPDASQLQVFGDDFPTRDGSCVRDYIHVTDLCQAHLKAADRLLAGAATGAEFYNLANGSGFTVLEVIEACRQVTGQPIGFKVMARRAGDPAALVGDASLARHTLNWVPLHTALQDIVRTAWTWMIRSSA
jgi:UDP-glucose 4-epimerase